MIRKVFEEIVAGYPLKLHGVHGIDHWARVLENGRRLAPLTGADPFVVDYFAIFHDARRKNEGHDPDHGKRGGQLARRLHRKRMLDLTGEQLDLLDYACEYHNHGLTEADVTVQTCWDADRLDLGRGWITRDPAKLCTQAACDPELMAWAEDRGRREVKVSTLDEWLRYG
jgi:uncharacterized protein